MELHEGILAAEVLVPKELHSHGEKLLSADMKLCWSSIAIEMLIIQ